MEGFSTFPKGYRGAVIASLRSDPGLGDDVPCEKCGAVALDTGLECDECGHDNWQAVTGSTRRVSDDR